MKYASDGTWLLTEQFGTTANDDGYGVAVDANGNAYIVGYTDGALEDRTHLGGSDAFIYRLAP